MKLALTYDDGPNPNATPALLDLLAEHGVKATFFMVGKWINTCPDLAKQIVSAGHKIGNHTQTHPKLTEIPRYEAFQEMMQFLDSMFSATQKLPFVFRPPFILYNEYIVRQAKELHMDMVLYDAAAGDGGAPRTAEEIEEKIVRELDGKSGIILMHDGSHETLGADRASTVEATRRLILRFKENAEFVFPEEVCR